jgi:hypothetical protein
MFSPMLAPVKAWIWRNEVLGWLVKDRSFLDLFLTVFVFFTGYLFVFIILLQLLHWTVKRVKSGSLEIFQGISGTKPDVLTLT